MPEDLSIPLLAAAVFTAGCWTIKRLEAYASVVERTLLVALVMILVFGTTAALDYYISYQKGQQAAHTGWAGNVPEADLVDP